MVRTAADSILKEAHDDPNTLPPTVGDKWLSRWLIRHPQYNMKKARAIEVERRRTHNRDDLEDWYRRLQSVIAVHGILENDIWNFGETGFQIGIGKDQWIITRDHPKTYLGLNSNREYVTVVEAISAAGDLCPPFIIMPGKCIFRGWFDKASKGTHIGVSDSCYMTDSLAFQWIQGFNLYTKHRTRGDYRLLLCNGYGSHLTYEFVQYCEKHKIVLFFLPPHSSHLLQPLDIGVFHAYKHHHAEAVSNATYAGCGKFTKTDFLHALSTIRKKTFKNTTIRHAFRLAGLVPWKPAVVLANLPEIRPSTPSSTTSSEAGSSVLRYDAVQDGYGFTRRLSKFIKGSIAQGWLAAGLQRQLDEITRVQREKAERDRASRRRAPVGGVVSSTSLAHIERKEEELDALKERTRLRAKWKQVMVELVDYAIDREIIIKRQRKSRNKEETSSFPTV
ncbi:uncharacterized protein KD926_006437 [Aspergillus affinis]|uniref:uncharacterized protein n=1 Tax=Aspergillus affinis TaxID=1070780 RepID=UPI0022FDF26C|nr:uncharacterized protein KD926_006437 [Aspergillus affinis]KAI9041891.1 hypothetical protein KD926_006437 [Aspergillus affinis]